MCVFYWRRTLWRMRFLSWTNWIMPISSSCTPHTSPGLRSSSSWNSKSQNILSMFLFISSWCTCTGKLLKHFPMQKFMHNGLLNDVQLIVVLESHSIILSNVQMKISLWKFVYNYMCYKCAKLNINKSLLLQIITTMIHMNTCISNTPPLHLSVSLSLSVDGGELFDRIIDENYKLTELDSVVFIRQICEGLHHMHRMYFLHLDLKVDYVPSL